MTHRFLMPLHYKVYRLIWLTTLVSNIGTWTQNVSASLLMTHLTHSATLNALVQTASMVPMFLFAFLAGIIADLYDRKSIIMIAQCSMAVVAFVMALLTHFGDIKPITLLSMLFLMNIGLAFNQPTWQVISSTLVPTNQIKQAAVLNNLSYNLSRCIGPALAGICFTRLGPSWLFLLNAISFLGVIVVFYTQVESTKVCHLYSWRQNFVQGYKESFTFLRCFDLFRYILIKAFWYFLLSSCLWALLPYLIIIHNHMSNADLGLLMSGAGIGAIANSIICYRLRGIWSDKQMTTFALLLNAGVFLGISILHTMSLLFILLFVFGVSWSMAVSVFNGMMQSEFPLNARARLIGIYYLFFSAAQALGGCWSGLAIHQFGIHYTLDGLALLLLLVSIWYLWGNTLRYLIHYFNFFNRAV